MALNTKFIGAFWPPPVHILKLSSLTPSTETKRKLLLQTSTYREKSFRLLKSCYNCIPSTIDELVTFFQVFLDYAYTGSCSVDIGNVKDLLKFADQYQFLDVVQMCCCYLVEELNPHNCFETLEFANQYFCKELIQKIRLFIRHHFGRLLRESKEFLDISPQYLQAILKDDELNVKTEQTVFEGIKLWINQNPLERKCDLLDLLKCVR